jgi:hypothetical protein
MKTLLKVLSLSLLLAACASSSSPTDSAAAAVSKSETAPDLTGTWAFALSASDVAVPLRESCAKSSANDAAKKQACWDEVAAEAAREKIRFTSAESGKSVWTSFGSEGSKEIIFVQVPVELVSDGPGHVLAKVAGPPKGDMAAQFAKASINVMRIELVDARTIAMNDPKKGRLVYTKE